MDGVTWYLLGVLTGVAIVIGCAVLAFCWGANELNEQGEPERE